MANDEQVERLKAGTDGWNLWRAENPTVAVDLRGADLNGANLSGAQLIDASLGGADLCRADLRL